MGFGPIRSGSNPLGRAILRDSSTVERLSLEQEVVSSNLTLSTTWRGNPLKRRGDCKSPVIMTR